MTGPDATSGAMALQVATSDEPRITPGCPPAPPRQLHRELRARLVVVIDEADRLAMMPPARLNRLLELQRLLLLLAEEGTAAGESKDDMDVVGRLRLRREAERQRPERRGQPCPVHRGAHATSHDAFDLDRNAARGSEPMPTAERA